MKCRFIPVYTGNISAPLKQRHTAAVYPCVYREHHFKCRPKFSAGGLSLCVQGTYAIMGLIIPKTRFIPVCTGNIVIISPFCKYLAVYPCVYREHAIFINNFSSSVGLSLCVQGTYQL